MGNQTERKHDAEFLISERPGELSRSEISVAPGQNLKGGAVLGKVTADDVTVAYDVGNTGNGTFAATPTLGSKAEVGDYVLVCTAEAANAGTFSVTSPSGQVLAPLTVAVAYAGDHINGTLQDGTNDWDIDDIVTVTVAALGGTYKIYDDDATDGTEVAAGVLRNAVDATGFVRKPGVIFERSAELDDDLLDWGVNDANEKAAGIADLLVNGIKIR